MNKVSFRSHEHWPDWDPIYHYTTKANLNQEPHPGAPALNWAEYNDQQLLQRKFGVHHRRIIMHQASCFLGVQFPPPTPPTPCLSAPLPA